MVDALARAPDGEAGVSEIARETGLDKATVHRVLRVFLARGVVAQAGAGGRYRLGSTLDDWASRRQATQRPLELARPHLLSLWQRCGETVHFTAPVGDEVVVLQVLESEHQIRVSGRVGERVPMHCTASGQLFLAFGSPATRERVLAGPLAKVTARTVTRRAALLERFETVRRDGLALDLEECLPHANAVAAPVLDIAGRCLAAVVVIGPAARLSGKTLADTGQAAVQTAAALSQSLRHLTPEQWRL